MLIERAAPRTLPAIKDRSTPADCDHGKRDQHFDQREPAGGLAVITTR